jgi:folate-dependent phosphoribosylglycinamide formyltransferase PurN
MSRETPRLVIITSGDGGTTAEAFIHATQAGFVDAVVTDIIYNNPPTIGDPLNHITARVERMNRQYAEYGAHAGARIQTHLINNSTHPEGLADKTAITDEASDAMCEIFEDADAALGLLLGFRKRIRGSLQTKYADRGLLTNNHPGRVDVPELRGAWGNAVHQRAYELARAGKIDHTGITVQLVDPEYDLGTVLETIAVPISLQDTAGDIRNNVQMAEKIYTPKIIGDYLAHLQENG